MGDLARDLTYAVRTLLRAPLLLITTVLTLGLGIGLSTGVLAVAYGVLLRPLPYDDPLSLVVISLHRPGEPTRDVGLPLPDVDEWRRRVRAFEHLAAHSAAEFTFRGAGDPRTVRGAMLALGSSETGAVGLLMRSGGMLVLAGVAIGTAGAFVSARTLRHLLHGVAPFDPLTFVAGIGLATAVSLLACYLPARRATSISPAELLREG